MAAAAEAIRSAALRLASVKERAPSSSPEDLQVHGAILDTAMAITHAVGNLISCATASQNEIVAQGRGSSTKEAFYKKNNRWMDGLISAAKAVAIATGHLVECADGVITGTRRMEELIVAGNEVSASVAQLVAASKVKALLGSPAQARLEAAAKAVSVAIRMLVSAVEKAKQQKDEFAATNWISDHKFSGVHDFKRQEMEQQVRILTIQNELEQARRNLAGMRKSGYHLAGSEYQPL